MLAGVLNGMMKSAPVLILERQDLKSFHKLNTYLSSRQRRPIVEDSFRLRKTDTIELTAWHRRVMVFAYFDGLERPNYSGPVQGATEYVSVVNDLEHLVEAVKTGNVYFTVPSHNNAYPDDWFRVRLTAEGQAALSVWLDQVLEQM